MPVGVRTLRGLRRALPAGPEVPCGRLSLTGAPRGGAATASAESLWASRAEHSEVGRPSNMVDRCGASPGR